MAAILQPRPAPRLAGRPALRVVQGGLAQSPARAQVITVPWRSAVALAVAVMVVGALAVAVGRGALASLVPAAPPAAASAATGERVVVQPGDTMWSIARRVQPSGDVRPLVDRLVASHGTASIQPGDVVIVP